MPQTKIRDTKLFTIYHFNSINVMKKLMILAMAALAVVACQPKEDPQPEPTPSVIRPRLSNRTVALPHYFLRPRIINLDDLFFFLRVL